MVSTPPIGLFRVLLLMLGSWIGGVWVAWGATGYLSPTLCAGTDTRWVWLIAAAVLAVVIGLVLAREVRRGRLAPW